MKPCNAKGDSGQRGVTALRSDNKSLGDFWILTDGYHVSIREQKSGHAPTQGIRMPVNKFNAFIDWYMRDQAPRKRLRALR